MEEQIEKPQTTQPQSAQKEIENTYAFNEPPQQPGEKNCAECSGLGWMVRQTKLSKCEPCDAYSNNEEAANAAAEMLKKMYAQLEPNESLATGDFETFVLHKIPRATDACPECNNDLVSIEAGYDRYAKVTLEGKVLQLEDAGFSDDGNGPHYLFCGKCNNAYDLPDEIDFR